MNACPHIARPARCCAQAFDITHEILLHFIRIAGHVLSAMPCAAAKLTLLVRVPLRHQCPMCALANLLQICNGFKRSLVSDIFIVRDWDNGQPLTIIRRICLNDVYDQIVSFGNLCFSNLLAGAPNHIHKRYGRGRQALKVSDVSKASI